MPVEVTVVTVDATPEEVFKGKKYAAVTDCPVCKATCRYADVSLRRARKGVVVALHDRCRCRLLPKFYEREIPPGVELWTVDAAGKPHRLQMMGGVLYTPQWIAFVDPVDGVRVVAETYEDNKTADAFSDVLRKKGVATYRTGDEHEAPRLKLNAIPRTRKPRKKKAVK
jgi:hypothetical protein